MLGPPKYDIQIKAEESLISLNKFLPLHTEMFLRFSKCLMSQQHEWTL